MVCFISKAPKLRLLLERTKVWLASAMSCAITHVRMARDNVADTLENRAIDGRSRGVVSCGSRFSRFVAEGGTHLNE